MIEKLQVRGGYRPENYENPALQRHYASLQAIALALEQDVDEDVVDRIGKQIGTFREKIWKGEPPTAIVGSKGGTKRKARDDSEEIKPKREKKTASGSDDLDSGAGQGQQVYRQSAQRVARERRRQASGSRRI